MKKCLMIKIVLVGWSQLTALGCVALGTDWVPVRSDEVLLKLPQSYSRHSEGMFAGDSTQPLSEQKMAEQIRYYLDIARETGDERYLGYAHTLMTGLSAEDINTGELTLAYAALLQRVHRFEEALALLEKLMITEPMHGQANLMSAYINVTLGRPEEAKEFCRNAGSNLGSVIGINCAVTANMLQGKSERAEQVLSNLLVSSHLSAVERIETLINLAEISKIRGDYENAQKFFSRLIDEDPNDTYVLARLADTYISAGEYDECIQLLENKKQPSLQLRYAIAVKNKAGEVQGSLQESLHNYFSVQLAREPNLSSRDYAAYLLSIKNQAGLALDVSLRNWQKQREIPDTELVLRSAWQSQQISKADTVIAWIEETGLQDHDINQLLTLFKGE